MGCSKEIKEKKPLEKSEIIPKINKYNKHTKKRLEKSEVILPKINKETLLQDSHRTHSYHKIGKVNPPWKVIRTQFKIKHAEHILKKKKTHNTMKK